VPEELIRSAIVSLIPLTILSTVGRDTLDFSNSSASLRVTLEYTVAADGSVATTDGSSATPAELSKTLLAVNRVNANNPESFFMMGTPELSEFNNG